MKLLSLCTPIVGEASSCITPPAGVPSAAGGQTLEKILQTGITIFIIVCVITALFFLIWSGIKWITSSGDKQKVQSARQTIIYSIVGLLLVFLSFLIISVIGNIFGVELIHTPLTPPCGPGDPGYPTC